MELLFALVVSLIVQFLFFVPAFLFRTDKLTDFSYSLSFVILASIGLFSSSRSLGHVLVFVMILFWACRLGGYLLVRVLKKGRDARFDSIRGRFWSFLGFWAVQGVVVWAVSLSSIVFFSSRGVLSWWSSIGAAIFLAGLLLETVADAQQFSFRNKKGNEKSLFTGGVWRYSQHPNYFGEILVWLGVFLFVLPGISNLPSLLFAAMSPAVIITTLLFFSGIPATRRRLEARFGKQRAYQEYKRRTSVLVPWPPKK